MENKTYLLLGLGVVGALLLFRKKPAASSPPPSDIGGDGDMLPQEIANQPESFASLYTVDGVSDCYVVKYVDGLYGLFIKGSGFDETAMTYEELEAKFGQSITLVSAAVPYSTGVGTLLDHPEVPVTLEISVVPVTFTADNISLFVPKFTMSAEGEPDYITYNVRLPSSVTILMLTPDDLAGEDIVLQEP
jgi:hypothetical protein